MPHAGDCHENQDKKSDDGGDDEDSSASESSSLSFDALSSNEPSESGNNRLLELQVHIEDTIDRLHGHALRIEAAGANHRRKRVELYRQRAEVRTAYDGFKTLALHMAKLEFNKASEHFLDRLAESFARRRIRLEYLERHQKKRAIDTHPPVQLEAPSLAPLPLSKPEGGDKPPDATVEKLFPDLKRVPVPSSRPQDQRTMYSGTVQTKLDPDPPPRRPEKAESVASVVLRKVGFPPPPRCANGVSFRCPYCRLEFHAHEAEKARWRYVFSSHIYLLIFI